MPKQAKKVEERPTAAELEEIPEVDFSRARAADRGLLKGRRISLRTLREAAGRTQAEVATRSEMAQGDVSRMEQREDVKLSTLRRYVGALDAKLIVAVVTQDGKQIFLDLGEAPGSQRRGARPTRNG